MVNRKLKIGLITAAIIGGGLIFFFANPETQSFFPPCWFYKITGLQCPGCGTQRAVHHFLHGNILTALKYNAILALAIPYLVLGFYFSYAGGAQRFPATRKFFFGPVATKIIAIVTIGYFIGRNIW